MKNYPQISLEIGKLVEKKNAAYGNSFEICSDFLKILYPKGVPVEAFGDMLCIIRIFDKFMRIATNKGAFKENPWQDVAGYGILAVGKEQKTKPNATKSLKCNKRP